LPAWVHGFAWGAIILLTLTLVGILQGRHSRDVWEGWRESSELRRPVYAEQVNVNAVFRTRANTWSNLAYVLVGFYAIAISCHDRRRPVPYGASYLAQTPALSLTFGLACCCLGVGSGLFHASLTRFGQQLDVAAMYAPLLVLIALSIGRRIPRLKCGDRHRNLPTWPISVFLIGVASLLLFLYKWSMSSTIVLSALIATLGFLAVLDRLQTSRRTDLRWLGWSCLALVTALICRELDIAKRFTGPNAWLQGHALWHILTSLSLGCMYSYYWSEVTTSSAKA
jgi:predicted membrane channel-forming protein YqfA (hemolysin III family)